MTIDENDLRAGLRALAGDVPPPPEGRAERSVRRSVRLRRTRVALSATLAVALAAPVAVVASHGREERVVPAVAATPVHLWPDRSDPGLTRLRWRAFNLTPHPTGSTPRFLFARRLPEAGAVVVAWAYCTPAECSSAVLAVAREVPDGLPKKWLAVRREIRSGVLEEPLSALVPYGTAAGGGNLLVVVSAPEARRVDWHSDVVQPETGGAGTLTSRDGVFLGDIGYVSADVTVTVRAADGLLGTGFVGDEEDATGLGRARPLDVPDVPEGWEPFDEVYGDGFVRAWSSKAFPGGRISLFVRCRAASPAYVSTAETKGEVPCDGNVHRIDSRRPEPPRDVEVSISSYDPRMAYAAAIATPRE